MIAVYKYVVYSKNIMFLKYILFAHRNDYCIQMLLSGKTEVASPEKLSAHNQSRFRVQQYDRILTPDSIFDSELHRYVASIAMQGHRFFFKNKNNEGTASGRWF